MYLVINVVTKGCSVLCRDQVLLRFADQYLSIILQEAGGLIALIFILLSERL